MRRGMVRLIWTVAFAWRRGRRRACIRDSNLANLCRRRCELWGRSLIVFLCALISLPQPLIYSFSPTSSPFRLPRTTSPTPPPFTLSCSRWPPLILPTPCLCAPPAKPSGTSASTTPTTRTHSPLPHIHTPTRHISMETALQPPTHTQVPRGPHRLHPRLFLPPRSQLLRTVRTRQTRFIY